MKKISVIVPVYNSKKELNRCIESISNQTYKNLEIICIDDGSTDGSGHILDALAQNDERIKVVHKTNKGESNARNIGLKMATGEYIAFCDCDDWIDKEMYEVLAKIIETEKVDLAASSWYKESDDNTQLIQNNLPICEDIITRDKLLKCLYMRDSYRGFAYMWNKLYKRELFEKQNNRILFDESLHLGGDVVFLAEIALNVKRAKYIDSAFYHYYQREESGCHTKNVDKLRDWLRAYEIVIQRFQEEHIAEEILIYVKRFLAYHASNAAEIAILNNNHVAKMEFQKFMIDYEQDYIVSNSQYPDRIERYYTILSH